MPSCLFQFLFCFVACFKVLYQRNKVMCLHRYTGARSGSCWGKMSCGLGRIHLLWFDKCLKKKMLLFHDNHDLHGLLDVKNTRLSSCIVSCEGQSTVSAIAKAVPFLPPICRLDTSPQAVPATAITSPRPTGFGVNASRYGKSIVEFSVTCLFCM